ncbi:MAG: peptidylprolyl isomerase [Cytophagaceae bacterium]|nr:peptidylprolyl isomerase [Cytophagaceae bacterium]MDW8455655.1 peptidylprolyl isomerase [Cytophagaceae bacterium]
MKHMKPFYLLLILIFSACKSNRQPASSSKVNNEPELRNEPILAWIGKFPIYSSDFEYVYKKNNASSEDAYTRKSLEDYLDLYINFRLKVKEAEELGMDTSSKFKQELDGYKKQLAQPYLTEKGVTEQLMKEAYERMKTEVNASHILVSCAPDADPDDTLKAYNKIMDLRRRIMNGEDFGKIAYQYSDDPSAKKNFGNLGYFTAFKLVYSFEDMAYKTPVGQISMPVRTRFGYHLIKVHDVRPSQGYVKVAHIMVRATEGISKEDSIAAKQKIDEIYNKLKAGESWESMVSQFSDDPGSKAKNGELSQWYGTGDLVFAFQEAAFKLQKNGDISKPVLTPYGWHIIKLIDKKPLESYQELEPTLKSKVAKDSRSELNKTLFLQRLRKENNLQENPKALEYALSLADSTLNDGNFFKKVDEKNNQVLFTINNEPYRINQFFEYLSKQKQKKSGKPQNYMKALYNDYVNSQLISYEERHLEEKYIDYKMLVKEYRDGILLFNLMDEKVWTKAIEDTAGLKAFFKNNNSKYRWNTRAFATIYNVSDKNTLNRLLDEIKKEKYPVKEPKIEPIPFDKNSDTLTLQAKRIIDQQLIPALVKDKHLYAEINCRAAAKENATLAQTRADSIAAYLTARGIQNSRYKIINQGKSTGKESDNDYKADIVLYSSSKKVLENNFNEKQPLSLQITDGAFQKGDNKLLDSLEWKPGNYTLHKDGRINYIVIHKVEEPREKTFEEARGLAISDYQNFLEKDWIAKLRQKYPPKINEEQLQKLVKKP